jgi:flavin reductase ActVB
VSLDPPLVLVCLARSAQSHEAFLSAANIGISILADGQRDIAMRFADSSASKFVDGTSIADYHSVPVVDGANAQLLCRVEDRIVKGDHTIIVAEVEDVSLAADAPPLLYWDRNFRQLAGS